MDRGDILSGAAFAAVVRAAAVFLVVLLVMALFSVRLIDRTMHAQVRLRVAEMAQSMSALAADGPLGGLVQRVESATGSAAGNTLAYAVFDATGRRMAGNTDLRPAQGTWIEAPVTLELADHLEAAPLEQSFLLHAVSVGDMTLVVGRSTAFVAAARRAAIRGFALTGFVVVLAMLAIGYVMSRRSQASLEGIGAVLDRVSQGETGARVPLSGRNDQIDRISRQINAHLDQLDALFGQTRRTATAVAHDLRRPLARATLGVERARDRVEAGEDARADIEQSLADLASLQAVIASILRIARIESGEAGEIRRFDLRSVLDEVAETFAPVAEDAGQVLDYTRAPSALVIDGDAQMLAQLVVNLVQNAITHAGSGARIVLTAVSVPGGVEFSVTDDGPGIPDALRTRVFEPFYRADDARSHEGSGMGLALVKAIADRHGAVLALEDAAPGLRVWLRFARFAKT